MISFLKGLFFDQASKISKMMEELNSSTISPEIEDNFLQKTKDLLHELFQEIQHLIASGDLDIESLASNNIIRYNTIHEKILNIELFRFLVIINYDEAEVYFKKKITKIYDEINCFFQNPPIITTISNSDDYFWAFPGYDIIAVPNGEQRNLLNLPDLYHEMGHLFFSQYEKFLIGKINKTIETFYNSEIIRVDSEQRATSLKAFYREKLVRWASVWVMEFSCDLIATYLVGPAYAWTNLKICTLSSGHSSIYNDSPKHPSDEARMRAICYLLTKMGHTAEVKEINDSWGKFLKATNNPVPANYSDIFPQALLEELAENVFEGCKKIDLRAYADQISKYDQPISKVLNDAWVKLFDSPDDFAAWEKSQIDEINASL
ncbi:MAG: hypothetical protein V4553_08930 [Bacteroidota bacterium]